jgi:uncharacterized membrane protein YcaP (DUF421 family)
VGQTCARAASVKKRFLDQATTFDFILVILIGLLTSRAVSGTAPFISTMLATASLIAAHWILSYSTRGPRTLSHTLKGSDTILIKRGKIDRAALRHSHMSDDDLAEDLRQQGARRPDEIEETRLERSGKLSVIKKD